MTKHQNHHDLSLSLVLLQDGHDASPSNLAENRSYSKRDGASVKDHEVFLACCSRVLLVPKKGMTKNLDVKWQLNS